jgi:hypothetical protein
MEKIHGSSRKTIVIPTNLRYLDSKTLASLELVFNQQELHALPLEIRETNVWDPDPDPHVLGPPGSGSGSISQRYESGSSSGSFPFSHKCVERTAK